jgi:hypothetical protein
VDVSGDMDGWVSVSESSFTLEPGKERVIYLDIDPPTNAAPEYHDATITVASECGAAKDDLVDYKVTAPGELESFESSGFSMLVLLWALVFIIIFIVVKAALDHREEDPRRRRQKEAEDHEDDIYEDENDVFNGWE